MATLPEAYEETGCFERQVGFCRKTSNLGTVALKFVYQYNASSLKNTLSQLSQLSQYLGFFLGSLHCMHTLCTPIRHVGIGRYITVLNRHQVVSTFDGFAVPYYDI